MVDRLRKRRRAIEEAFDSEIARLIRIRFARAAVDTEILLGALNSFDSPKNAALWLARPKAALHHRSPLNVAESASGKEAVMDLLCRRCAGLDQSTESTNAYHSGRTTPSTHAPT
jgi:uncharacterized protein (DUF2384 family)